MSAATRRHQQVGVRKVTNRLSAYLDRVWEGEVIVITDRGRPIARLTSLEPKANGSLGELAAAERR